MPGGASGRGTGSSLTKATIIVCGVASLVASLLSFLYELPVNHSCILNANKRHSTDDFLPDQFGFRR